MNTGTTVTFEINGTTAGSSYDQLNVTGAVNLDNDSGGGATLSLTLGYVPTNGDSYLLINNDGVDAVVGTFAGLPEGSYWRQGATVLHLTYSGGDGNDVVLSAVPTPLLINEIDYDQPGTDNAEFVELKNGTGAPLPLADFSLLLIQGNGGGGTINQTISLPAVTLAVDDYFVICGNAATVVNCDLDVTPNSDLLENGTPDAVAIAHNGNVLEALSYEGDSGAPYVEGSGSGLFDNNTGPRIGLSRYPDGVDTDQNNVDFSVRCISPGMANLAANTACDQPEITVLGNGVQIADGAMAASIPDGTDFGSLEVNTAITHSFTISNSGPYDLILSGSPVITVTPGTAFSLAEPPTTTIAANATTAFALRFAPMAQANYTATVQIANNDADEGLYTFVIAGEGKPAIAAINGVHYLTLQDAIDAAGAGETIQIITGTITEPATVAGLTQLGYITKSLTIEGGCDGTFTTCGPGTPTTLNAGGLGRGLLISGTIQVTLTNLIISDGDANAGGGDGNGGGLLVKGSTVDLVNTTIRNNRATNGGGIHVGSAVTCGASCIIANNSAADGGGVYIHSTGLTSTFHLDGGQIVTNTATNDGGGIYVDDVLAIYTQTLGTVGGNIANLDNDSNGDGGGIYIKSGRAAFSGGLLSTNRARRGGGLYNANGSLALSIKNTVVTANRATVGNGGGIYTVGDITVSDGNFSENSSQARGGGLYAMGEFTMAGTTVADNQALLSGGGIESGNNVTVISSQILSNTAGSGGGLHNSASATNIFTDTLVQNNRATDGGGGAMGGNGSLLVQSTRIISNSAVGDGGAIRISSGELTAIDSLFQQNSTGATGGAVSMGEAYFILENSNFISNTAIADGGGLSGFVGEINGGRFQGNRSDDYGGALSALAVTILHTQIISNVAPFGGGALVEDGSITGVDFTNNWATAGGGLYVEGALIISDTRFTTNHAVDGGGLYNAGETVMADSNFTDNEATNSGGALYNEANLDLARTRFERNRAGVDGGALALYGNEALADGTLSGESYIVNNLFVNNAASGIGAGIVISATGSQELLHNTIVSDTQGNGSGIAITGGMVGITNTIVASYTIGIENSGGTVTDDYNLFFGTTTPRIGTFSSGGNSVLNADPRFRDPANSDYELTNLSPASNAGIDWGIDNDLNGSIRPKNGAPDIGAFETALDVAEVNGVRFTTLQDAIDFATDGDLVKVAALTLTDLYTRVGFTQIGYITKSLTIVGGYDLDFVAPDLNRPSILDADYYGRVLVISGTIPVTLTNLIITHGDAFASCECPSPPIDENPQGFGALGDPFSAGVAALDVDIPITRRTPRESRVRAAGALANQSGFSAAGIADLTPVAVDEATLGAGGGILIQGSDIHVYHTRITENSAEAGGGVFVGSTFVCDATCVIDNNFAFVGAGVYVSTAAVTSTLQLNGGQIISNTAFAGGGVFVEGPSGYMTMTAGTIAENWVFEAGGGILIEEGTVHIAGGSVYSNTASETDPLWAPYGFGGGIYQWGGELLINNATVDSNRADFDGGGIYVEDGLAALTNVTIASNHAITYAGGGIFIEGGLLTVTNSSLLSNTAGDDGAGLFATEYIDLEQVAITGSTFQNNAAADSGGGLYVDFDARVLITATDVISNSAVDDGGGIKVNNAGHLSLVDSTVRNNQTADTGGGIYVEYATATIAGSQIVDNHALDDAGGLKAFDSAVVTITNSVILTNSAVSYGGGVVNDESTIVIDHTTIASNRVISATYENAGGGIDSYFGELLIEHSTIADNETTTGGGGLALSAGDIITLTNVTISGNRASSGGGIFLLDSDTVATLQHVSIVSNTAIITGGGLTITGADLTLDNTLIGSNVATGGAGLGNDCYGAVTSVGNNLVADPLACSGLSGSDLINVAPRVGPLQDNGGPATSAGQATATHALLFNSPALDAADSASCLATDQRGVTRPQSSGCDIGAFELIQPEIALLGNAIEIADGDSTPDLVDQTDFGYTYRLAPSSPTPLRLATVGRLICC
ncbi:MAG: choice-of-anchor Q domain-containing protein [Caldilineaceae bacterium]